MPFLLALIPEISTGQAAPTPMPSTIGNALAKVRMPVTDSACSTPTAAEALWITAVNRMPTRMPMSGFENMVSMFVNASLLRSGSTAPLMVCIPNIRIANPSMMLPTFL